MVTGAGSAETASRSGICGRRELDHFGIGVDEQRLDTFRCPYFEVGRVGACRRDLGWEGERTIQWRLGGRRHVGGDKCVGNIEGDGQRWRW